MWLRMYKKVPICVLYIIVGCDTMSAHLGQAYRTGYANPPQRVKGKTSCGNSHTMLRVKANKSRVCGVWAEKPKALKWAQQTGKKPVVKYRAVFFPASCRWYVCIHTI